MAWLNINEAEVTNVFFDGKGATVAEKFIKGDGTAGAAYYSAFFDQAHGLNVGDTVKISGIHGAKAEEYQGVWRAKTTMNKAKAEILTYASDAEPPAPF